VYFEVLFRREGGGGSRPWVHCFDNIWLAGGLGQHVGLAVRQADRQTGDKCAGDRRLENKIRI
jgi:hypothetical protein